MNAETRAAAATKAEFEKKLTEAEANHSKAMEAERAKLAKTQVSVHASAYGQRVLKSVLPVHGVRTQVLRPLKGRQDLDCIILFYVMLWSPTGYRGRSHKWTFFKCDTNFYNHVVGFVGEGGGSWQGGHRRHPQGR